jgi:hypothetical protein
MQSVLKDCEAIAIIYMFCMYHLKKFLRLCHLGESYNHMEHIGSIFTEQS